MGVRKSGEYLKSVCRAAGCKKEFRTKRDELKHLSDTGHKTERILIMRGIRTKSQPGERNPNAALTWTVVNEIRKKLSSGWSTYEVSRHYRSLGYKGTSQQNISSIDAFKTWKK